MNNYDQSSVGVNLELNVLWDNDLSRIFFDESFHVLQYSGMRQHSILVFNWFGDTDQSDFDFNDIGNYTFTKSNLINLLKSQFDDEELNSLANQEENKSFSRLDKQSLQYLVEYYVEDDVSELFQEYLTPNYQILTSRGYCQGDYSEVIFTKPLIDQMRSELTACKNMTDQQIAEYFQKDIDHLLWDSPLYARLTIDDSEEIYLDEAMTDLYTWDKEKALGYVNKTLTHENKAYILKWLDDNLPEQPEYRY